jgi:hypothetical protein
MLVPKTPANFDYLATTPEDDVGTTREIRGMNPITVTVPMQKSANG